MATTSPSRPTENPPVAGDYLKTTEICLVSIAFAFLLIRLAGRTLILRSPGLDDLFITLGFIFAVAFTTSHILAEKWGWGRHLSDLDLANTRKVLTAEWTQNWTWLLSEMFTKLSILFFYLRFAGDSERSIFRPIIWLVIVYEALWTTALTFIDLFACHPVDAFWNISNMKGTQIYRSDGCFSASTYRSALYAQAALDLASDAMVVILPMRTFWKLRATRGQRASMCILLFMGFLAIICAMVRFRILVDFTTNPDATWNGYEMYLWLAIKLYISIVCACLLISRPVFSAVFRPISNYYKHFRSTPSSTSSTSPAENNKEQPRSSATLAGFHVDGSNRNSALKEEETTEQAKGKVRIDAPDTVEPKSFIDLDDEHYGTHTPYFGEKRYSIRDSREMRPDQVPLPLSPSQLSIDVLPPPSPTTPKGLSPPPPLRSPSQTTMRSGAQSLTSFGDRDRENMSVKERQDSQDTTTGTMFSSEPPSRMSFRSSFIGVTVNTQNLPDSSGRRMSVLSQRRSSEALPENDRVQNPINTNTNNNNGDGSNNNSPIDPRNSSFSYTNSPIERLSFSNRGSMVNSSPIERGSLSAFSLSNRNSSLRGSLLKRKSSDALPETAEAAVSRDNSIVGSAKDLREGVYSARGSMYQPTLSNRRSSDALPESERGGGPAGRDGLYSARGSMYQPTLSPRRSSEALPENERIGGGNGGARESSGMYSTRGSTYQSLSPRRSSEALPENDRFDISNPATTGGTATPSRESSVRFSAAVSSVRHPSLTIRRSSDALPAGEGPKPR